MNEELRNKIAAMTPEQLQARAAEIDATQLSTLSAADASTLAEEREAIASRIAELRLAAFRGEQRRLQVLNNPTPGHQPPANPQKHQKRFGNLVPCTNSPNLFYHIDLYRTGGWQPPLRPLADF